MYTNIFRERKRDSERRLSSEKDTDFGFEDISENNLSFFIFSQSTRKIQRHLEITQSPDHLIIPKGSIT